MTAINQEHIKPLPKKKIEWSEFWKERPDKIRKFERVLFLNPKKLYRRIAHKIDPYKRSGGIQMEDLFPKLEGKCACGCKKKPEASEPGAERQWQRKWASLECESFAGDVLSIINNYFGKPAFYISLYYGKRCSQCPEEAACVEQYDLELDHIVGVKHGGGYCWLSNYRWLCRKCHREKTNKDFNFKKPKEGTIEFPK